MTLRHDGLRRLLGRKPLASRSSMRVSVATPSLARRCFSGSRTTSAKNQIYDAVRRPADFDTYHLLSASSRVPLITLWTASWCPTCPIVSPILYSLVESGVGEAEGGVALCTVEYDSPDVMREGFGQAYVISSLPTILAFEETGPRMSTRLMDPANMTDKEFLAGWIREEARHVSGGSSLTGWFRM
ncbi:uncharacterized protein DNG_02597 [Cephalotrichum gorgonifer]|uniref:Thioredoxin domain-containing protein n=1 Tax=Cephalotrichum gorgonifer TaxID=2041049 RepID=A0AAE8MUP7_9PEZI|nr:uncharacterized protein DNG_02597 [Cephalotrichum gorgonifer]